MLGTSGSLTVLVLQTFTFLNPLHSCEATGKGDLGTGYYDKDFINSNCHDLMLTRKPTASAQGEESVDVDNYI